MWTDRQKDALKAVDRWFYEYTTSRKPTKQICYISGYAGTGKTTLAKHFAESVDGEVTYGAFTGKAALVMRKNGCEGARTIHSMIYKAEEDPKTGEVTWHINRQSYLNDVSLIIIDECSMVSEDLAKDLLSFRKPILVLGDPGQLPPVNGAGYFTEKEPDVMLTEIHRQAKDNPIIHLATMIRNEQMPKIGTYGESRITTKMSTSDLLEADQVLVGRNVTRESFNTKIRKLKGFDPDTPVVSDKLICLQNNRDLGIFNGGMFDVEEMVPTRGKTNFLTMRLQSQDDDRLPFLAKIHKSFFFDDVPTPHWKELKNTVHATWGWAITVHKAQGSQWDDVFVMGTEAYCFREDKWKWLYTSVTRASSKLTLTID